MKLAPNEKKGCGTEMAMALGYDTKLQTLINLFRCYLIV